MKTIAHTRTLTDPNWKKSVAEARGKAGRNKAFEQAKPAFMAAPNSTPLKLEIRDFEALVGGKFTIQSTDPYVDVEDRFFTSAGTPVKALTVARALEQAAPKHEAHEQADQPYTEEQLQGIRRSSAVEIFSEKARKKAGLEWVQTRVGNHFKFFEASGESPWAQRSFGSLWPFKKTHEVVEILVARVPNKGWGEGREWNEHIVPASEEINRWLLEEGRRRGDKGWKGVYWEENSRWVPGDSWSYHPGTLRLVLSKNPIKSKSEWIPTYDSNRRQTSATEDDLCFMSARTGKPIYALYTMDAEKGSSPRLSKVWVCGTRAGSKSPYGSSLRAMLCPQNHG